MSEAFDFNQALKALQFAQNPTGKSIGEKIAITLV